MRITNQTNSKADFDTALTEKDSLMVLDCFATWCGPCKVIAPQVVKCVFSKTQAQIQPPPKPFILANTFPTIRFSDTYPSARFYKLDVDEVPEVAQELGIRAMPTFLLFKNGEKVGEVVGANPKALEAAIQQHV